MNHRNKIKTTLITVIFLLWFIGSLALLVWFARLGRIGLSLAMFGQYMLVFGILGIVSTFSNYGFRLRFLPLVLFPIVGFGCIAGGFIVQYGSPSLLKTFYASIPYILILLFLLVGLYLIISGFYVAFFRRRGMEQISAPNDPRQIDEPGRPFLLGLFLIGLGVVITLIMVIVLSMTVLGG